MKGKMPMIEAMSMKGMADRHWDEIKRITGATFDPTTVKLGFFFKKENNFEENIEQIDAIAQQGRGENKIEKDLHDMQTEWDDVLFDQKDWPDNSKDATIIPYTCILAGGIEDITIKLEEHNMKTSMMKGGSCAKFFEKDLDKWHKFVQGSLWVIETQLKVQSTWISLENVFKAPDIVMQIPELGAQFQVIDRQYKDIMKHMTADKHVRAFMKYSNLLQTLKDMDSKLEVINKGLNA